MRILLALEPSGGGSGRHVADLADGLCRRGHAVTLVHGVSRAEHSFLNRISAIGGIRVIAHAALVRPIGPHDVKALSELIRIVKTAGPFDILHGHSSKAGALIRLLPRSIPGARVYTPHAFRTMDPQIGRLPKLAFTWVERTLKHRTDHLVCVSEAEASYANATGLNPKSTSVIVNGIPASAMRKRSKLREELGISDTTIAVVFVGRLSPQKDPVRFAEAISMAHEVDPRVQGYVIGDGELRQRAQAVANPQAVRLLGSRPAAALLPGFDLFAMTSRYEAMPYTLIEALHAGLPILSTGVGGTSQTVLHECNGTILDVDATAAEVSEAIVAFAQLEPFQRLKWSNTSKSLSQHFTSEVMVDRTIQAYRRLNSEHASQKAPEVDV